MSAPDKGNGEQVLRTLVSSFPNVLKLIDSRHKTETRKFESLTLLEAGLGFGFSYPSGYDPKPEWRLNGSRAILLSILSVSFHFGGGKL
jgi:hypothetical protein